MGCLTMTNNEEYNDYLAHYGVPGMKWGQRRARKKANKAVKQWEKSQKLGWKALGTIDEGRKRNKMAKSQRLALKSKKKADKAMKIVSKIEKSQKALSKVSKEEKKTILDGAKETNRIISDNTPWADIASNKKQGVLTKYKAVR